MIGGALSDRLARVGHNDSAMRVTVVSIALMAACSTLYPIISTPSMMLLLFAAAMLAAAAAAATGAVALITLSPNQIRAQATALYWIVKNLTGLLLGPVSVGLLTDRVFGDPQQVGSSMSVASAVFGAIGIAALLLGVRHYRASVSSDGS